MPYVRRKTPVMDQLMSQCPFVKRQCQRPGSGTAGGTDGQLGGGTSEHGCRPYRIPGADPNHEINRGWRFLRESGVSGSRGQLQENMILPCICSAWYLTAAFTAICTHLYGLLELAKRHGLKKVYVHCFLDGRDTPPASGKGSVEQLEKR